jgi:threonine dehydrogenase-like Zn-dependent dehydrogenase
VRPHQVGRGDRDREQPGQRDQHTLRHPAQVPSLVKLPVGEDSALLASLLTLSDVFCTGHHAAVKARVGPHTTVTVIGDRAVGLSAVLAAKRLGADQILLMGRHQERTQLGREFGATNVVAELGPLDTTQAAWSGLGRRRLVPTRALVRRHRVNQRAVTVEQQR